MAVFKSQFTRALPVIVSEYCNIPFPAEVAVGITTSLDAPSMLIDEDVDFVALNVKTGDIVYNTSSSTAATVVSVVNEHQVQVNADIFDASGYNYVIYQASPQTGLGNTGCYLIADAECAISVTTVGGDLVDISLNQYVNCGLQVVKVSSITGEANITALW